MKTIFKILCLFTLQIIFGQNTCEKCAIKFSKTNDTVALKNCIKEYESNKKKEICLQAKGAVLILGKQYVKYGTPLCVEVNNVNTFFMKGDATYEPINYDFSTKAFLDIELEINKEDGGESDNEVVDSESFEVVFRKFQTSFQKINSYSSLKNTLINQIRKDSIFIENIKNFQNRASSSYISIYDDSENHLKDKKLIIDELESIEEMYFEMSSIYQQLNKIHKNDKLTLSGELKDGKTALKFKDILATIETTYLFEEEMSKAKTIHDSLTLPKNRQAIIAATHEGIDLYDEIQNKEYKITILSDNVYDDEAKIKPQLKNSKGKVLHEYREFKVKTYGNLKVNGSAGYFLNFISDEEYSLRMKNPNDSNSKVGVIENNKNAIKHSLGALLHVYYNFKGDIDLGGSVGLSINDDSNAGFYLGLSGFFTEKNRLVITSGISFLKVKQLNTANLVMEDGRYDFINEDSTEIKYDNIYKSSFFIGLSYNLF